jgi:hypothetical protein
MKCDNCKTLCEPDSGICPLDQHTAASAGSLADLVPTNWLDPLLTGKDRAIGQPPYNCRDIENLLRAIKKRIARAESK